MEKQKVIAELNGYVLCELFIILEDESYQLTGYGIYYPDGSFCEYFVELDAARAALDLIAAKTLSVGPKR